MPEPYPQEEQTGKWEAIKLFDILGGQNVPVETAGKGYDMDRLLSTGGYQTSQTPPQEGFGPTAGLKTSGGAEIFTSPEHDKAMRRSQLETMLMAPHLSPQYKASLSDLLGKMQTEEIERQKLEMERGRPEREAKAQLGMQMGLSPMRMTEEEQKSRLRTGEETTKQEISSREQIRVLHATPLPGIFTGTTYGDLVANPTHLNDLIRHVTGVEAFKNLGSFLQAMSMLGQSRMIGEGADRDNFMAFASATMMAHMAGEFDPGKYLKMVTGPDGKPRYTVDWTKGSLKPMMAPSVSERGAREMNPVDLSGLGLGP